MGQANGRGHILAAAQDGGDGLVGARIEQERPRTGGVDALGSVTLDKPEYPDGGAEALFGMRA